MYDDARYAQSRLEQTIVRNSDNEPVTVLTVESTGLGKLICECWDHVKEKEQTYPLDSLNLKPIPLGYMNYRNYCAYLSRMPMRQDWRQGLRRRNMTNPPRFLDFNHLDINFINMYRGVYPTIERVKYSLAMFETRMEAFSRCFALEADLGYDDRNTMKLNGYVIHYKNRRVGTISKKDEVVFNSDSIFLKERFERTVQ